MSYTWRAKLEEAKKQKAGNTSDSSDSADSSVPDGDSKNSSDESHEAEIEKKTSSFKKWAEEQTGSSIADIVINQSRDLPPETYVQRPRSTSPEAPDTSDLQPPDLVPVNIVGRPAALKTTRETLPAFQSQHDLVGIVKSHSIVIVTGGTGSGKTTQIPQYLYEAGFTGIGITQPRRVAAVFVAKRVAQELGPNHGSKVAHQIQFESTVSQDTEIKFMTEGILLRELYADFSLLKYEIIILDEAHERSMNTDILIGMLSRVVRVRNDPQNPLDKPLRVIIMSATLRISDFTDNKALFQIPPPIISIPASEAPVTIHFSRRTELSSYVQEAANKAAKIHEKLPPGDILVFLTGQQEIYQCMELLKEKLQKVLLTNGSRQDANMTDIKSDGTSSSSRQDPVLAKTTRNNDAPDDSDDSNEGLSMEQDDDYASDSGSDVSDIEETEEEKARSRELKKQMYVEILPLYSSLKAEEQNKISHPPVAQCRRIILATNVAETSLTIPGIRYVVDSGRAKVRRYNGSIESFEIDWISKASADQRKGRAGRTGPGHVYRLYSSAVFDSSFPDFTDPEILHTPLEDVVLQLKNVLQENIKIKDFPFPTRPDEVELGVAYRLLRHLRALDGQDRITQIGKGISIMALPIRLSKMVVEAIQRGQMGLLPYVIALAAVMSVDNSVFKQGNHPTPQDQNSAEAEHRGAMRKFVREMKKITQNAPASEFMRLLATIYASDRVKALPKSCIEKFLPLRTLEEITRLRQQITTRVTSNFNISGTIPVDLKSTDSLTQSQSDELHKIVGTAFVDQICIIAPDAARQGDIYKSPYIPLAPLIQESATIHPSCTCIKQSPIAPKYILYSALSASANNPDKIRIKVLAPIEPSWIADIAKATPLLKYSDAISQNPADIEIVNGSEGRERRIPVTPTISINGSGRQGWKLPTVKITQKLVGMKWIAK